MMAPLPWLSNSARERTRRSPRRTFPSSTSIMTAVAVAMGLVSEAMSKTVSRVIGSGAGLDGPLPGRPNVGDRPAPADQNDHARHLFLFDRSVDGTVDPLEAFGIKPQRSRWRLGQRRPHRPRTEQNQRHNHKPAQCFHQSRYSRLKSLSANLNTLIFVISILPSRTARCNRRPQPKQERRSNFSLLWKPNPRLRAAVGESSQRCVHKFEWFSHLGGKEASGGEQFLPSPFLGICPCFFGFRLQRGLIASVPFFGRGVGAKGYFTPPSHQGARSGRIGISRSDSGRIRDSRNRGRRRRSARRPRAHRGGDWRL